MKRKNVVALMIGRGGSTLPDKNILPVCGIPLMHYQAFAAVRSNYVGRYYCSSDCDKILEKARQAGYVEIRRPGHLALPDSQSSEVVKHALEVIAVDGPVAYLVVQHANVGTITHETIDNCLEILFANPELTAVVPAHRDMEHHPYRSFLIQESGVLRPLAPRGVSANRQDLPDAVFLDHSIWAINLDAVKQFGPSHGPWPCMGSRIRPYITEGCFDVHALEDVKKTELWVSRYMPELPNF